MKTHVHTVENARILECLEPIRSAGDALEVVSAGIENDASRILIEDRHLPAAFFDLRSGFAGEFVQKLQNYHLRLAVVFTNPEAHGERFVEFVREARRGRAAFGAFDDRGAALAWLGGS